MIPEQLLIQDQLSLIVPQFTHSMSGIISPLAFSVDLQPTRRLSCCCVASFHNSTNSIYTRWWLVWHPKNLSLGFLTSIHFWISWSIQFYSVTRWPPRYWQRSSSSRLLSQIVPLKFLTRKYIVFSSGLLIKHALFLRLLLFLCFHWGKSSL